MDVRALKDLCQRQDELAAILEIMEGEPVIVDLHRESSDALNQALSEIERLRSHADLHRETSNALRDALAEINRLKLMRSCTKRPPRRCAMPLLKSTA